MSKEATTSVSESVVQMLRRSNANGRACGNSSCDNDDRTRLTINATDDRGFASQVQCAVCGHMMLATPVDPGVLTILRRHSTEGTLCSNVECAIDNPTLLEVAGSPDSFGFVQHVRCVVCGQLMSTKCYDNAQRKKMRVLSTSELKTGDHIAWHTGTGHWHNVIFLDSLGMESDGRTSRFSMIEYRYRGCCNNGVVESVRRLDFHFVDVYRIVYTDAYTDAYSVERARRLTRPGTNISPLTGGCENIARWCKTGHQSSKLSLVVQKLSFEKQELNVVHKTSTFVSLALVNGLIPDTSSKVKIAETVVFTIVPAVLFFFSIVIAQVKREHDEIQPRRENIIIRGADANARRTRSGRCCNSENCHKWWITYSGPLTRVFVRELTANVLPVATFVGVGYAVSGALAGETWAVAVVEFISAIVASPPSFAFGVFIGTFVERYLMCCCCCCCQPTTPPPPPQQPTTTSITIEIPQTAGADHHGPASHESDVQGESDRSVGSNSDVQLRPASERTAAHHRSLPSLAKVTPV